MLRFIKNLEFFRSCLITPQERPHNHRIATDNSSIYNTLLILNMFTRFLNIHPASRASFCFLGWRGEKETLPAWNLGDRRSPNFWTSQSCSLSSNWFIWVRPSVYRSTDGHNQAHCSKRMVIRPGFENLSWQQAAHAQQRSYSIHAKSFSSSQNQVNERKTLLVGGWTLLVITN